MIFRQGQRGGRAGGQYGQQVGFLFVRPTDQNGLRREGGGDKGAGHEIAPHLFDHRHHLCQPKAHTAEFFRYRNAEPAEFRNL